MKDIKWSFILILLVIRTITVYFLWNWLAPEMFEFRVITIWQSLGLVLLSNSLFHRPTVDSLKSP